MSAWCLLLRTHCSRGAVFFIPIGWIQRCFNPTTSTFSLKTCAGSRVAPRTRSDVITCRSDSQPTTLCDCGLIQIVWQAKLSTFFLSLVVSSCKWESVKGGLADTWEPPLPPAGVHLSTTLAGAGVKHFNLLLPRAKWEGRLFLPSFLIFVFFMQRDLKGMMNESRAAAEWWHTNDFLPLTLATRCCLLCFTLCIFHPEKKQSFFFKVFFSTAFQLIVRGQMTGCLKCTFVSHNLYFFKPKPYNKVNI